MGPTAYRALDLRLDRGRSTLTGWRAHVTPRGIKTGGGRRLALRGSPPATLPTHIPSPIYRVHNQ
jgi:hypothetical protein